MSDDRELRAVILRSGYDSDAQCDEALAQCEAAILAERKIPMVERVDETATVVWARRRSAPTKG